MYSVHVTTFTTNLLNFVRSGDLTRARNYAGNHPKAVAAMKPHQISLVNRAARQWGAPPIF